MREILPVVDVGGGNIVPGRDVELDATSAAVARVLREPPGWRQLVIRLAHHPVGVIAHLAGGRARAVQRVRILGMDGAMAVVQRLPATSPLSEERRGALEAATGRRRDDHDSDEAFVDAIAAALAELDVSTVCALLTARDLDQRATRLLAVIAPPPPRAPVRLEPRVEALLDGRAELEQVPLLQLPGEDLFAHEARQRRALTEATIRYWDDLLARLDADPWAAELRDRVRRRRDLLCVAAMR